MVRAWATLLKWVTAISTLLAVILFFAGVTSCYRSFNFDLWHTSIAFEMGGVYIGGPDWAFSCWLLVLLLVTPLWLPRLVPKRRRIGGICPFCAEAIGDAAGACPKCDRVSVPSTLARRAITKGIAVITLFPFCFLILLYLFHDRDRSVNPLIVNEPRRQYDPNPPSISFGGYLTTVQTEVLLGTRRYVLNLPWGWAFVGALVIPMPWLPRALWRMYRRDRQRALETRYAAALAARRCPKCGYDVPATAGRCPECGTECGTNLTDASASIGVNK